MLNDVAYGLRQLRRNPFFAAIAILTLSLGIGANTAIFSVVNAVLLKPLPFPAPAELVAVGMQNTREPEKSVGAFSYPDFFDLRQENSTLQHLAVYRGRSLTMMDGNDAVNLRGQKVSADFLDVLGVKPRLGRDFKREDEQAGGGPGGFKIILSHALWRSRFQSDANVLGRVLTLERQPYTVIGVMPEGFRFPIIAEAPEFYITIAEDAANADGSKPVTQQRGNHMLEGVARLKPGVTRTQALANLETITRRLQKEFPDTNTDFTAVMRPLREELVGDVRTALYVVFGAVVCLLLIANANVANLLLARATVRTRDIALRAAVGASRSRLIRQLLTESMVLAALGGLGGLLVAQWGTDALIAVVPKSIPRIHDIQLDGVVLAFTLLVSTATGVIFGIFPAWQSSHVDLSNALKAGGRGTSGSTLGKNRFRRAVVAVEIALALVLLVCAGLLVQSFARLGRVDPGYEPDRLLTARISNPDAAYPKSADLVAFYDQLLTRLRALPGVESASTILPLPLSGSQVVTSFDIEERPLPEGQRDAADTRIVSTDYFKTMGIPVRQGRAFAETDRLEAKQVVIINEQFAKKHFPGENPVGKRIEPGWSITEESTPMREIVGVVGNVRHESLSAEFTPEMYLPASQVPVSMNWLLLRSATSDPAALTNMLRAELAKVDKEIALTRAQPFTQYMTDSLARARFNTLLISLFAGLALLLTAVGIYGVMAYSVAQRTSEIGLRMALGAAQSAIFRLIVGEAMAVVAVSVGVGLLSALAATRLLTSMLYGVNAWDPITFSGIVLLIALVAFLAAWLPARRAMRVSPMEALRSE